MYFVGVDLAWSDRNTTALAVAEGDSLEASLCAHKQELRSEQEIADFIALSVGTAPSIVAIDAPLIVKNEDGGRPVDREISRQFRRFEAGAYFANRSRWARLGQEVRGERMVQCLAEEGFVHSPRIQKRDQRRLVFEVYPHPAMVSLFHLNRTLKYKRKRNRPHQERLRQFDRYRQYLKGLAFSEPRLTLDEEVIGRDLASLKGESLETYEDLLDAVFCAYIAYYSWYWGPERYEIFGDEHYGYILVPMTPWMRAQLYSSPRSHLVQE